MRGPSERPTAAAVAVGWLLLLWLPLFVGCRCLWAAALGPLPLRRRRATALPGRCCPPAAAAAPPPRPRAPHLPLPPPPNTPLSNATTAAPDAPDAAPLGEAYAYVPLTVLGDFRYEQEPDWLGLPRRGAEELWAGLEARNWTSGRFE